MTPSVRLAAATRPAGGHLPSRCAARM